MDNFDISKLSDDVKALNPELVGYKASKPSKYGNIRTTAGGMTFASGKEAVEIGKLIIADEKHLIFGLRLQVGFPLHGGNKYIADAVYLDDKLEPHIIDCKGYQTPEFKIKAKLFKEKYGREIELL